MHRLSIVVPSYRPRIQCRQQRQIRVVIVHFAQMFHYFDKFINMFLTLLGILQPQDFGARPVGHFVKVLGELIEIG